MAALPEEAWTYEYQAKHSAVMAGREGNQNAFKPGEHILSQLRSTGVSANYCWAYAAAASASPTDLCTPIVSLPPAGLQLHIAAHSAKSETFRGLTMMHPQLHKPCRTCLVNMCLQVLKASCCYSVPTTVRGLCTSSLPMTTLLLCWSPCWKRSVICCSCQQLPLHCLVVTTVGTTCM